MKIEPVDVGEYENREKNKFSQLTFARAYSLTQKFKNQLQIILKNGVKDRWQKIRKKWITFQLL